MTYINKLGSIYLNNAAGAVVAGWRSDRGRADAICDRAPTGRRSQPELDAVFAGGAHSAARHVWRMPAMRRWWKKRSRSGSRAAATTTRSACSACSGRNCGAAVATARSCGACGRHALFDAYTEVYGGTVEDTPGGGDAGSARPRAAISSDATITLRRAAFWAAIRSKR